MTNKDDQTDPTKTPKPHMASDPNAQTVFDEGTLQHLNTTVLPPPAGMVGMILDGRYFIERELGRGGIGAVYFAQDRKLVNKPVVVKVLLEKTLQDEWAVRKFQHEKEALARVDHPGIIGVLDSGKLPDGKPYIVMQYVEGVTLRSLIRPEGADLDRAAVLIEQIGHALSAAHEDGIVHRDLKPENIMIQSLTGDREQAKVIDFGIAKIRDSQVAPSTVVGATAGTIAYMSPEQLRAEKVTAASDIYALGAIAYELVTGRRPFNPETMFQLLEMQRDGVRVRPSDLRPALPEAAQAVILKALAFDPRDRYQTTAELGEDFAKAINSPGERTGRVADRGVTANTTPTLIIEPERPKPASRTGMIAVSLIVLAAVIAAVAWWLLKSPGSPPPQVASPASAPASERTLNYWLTVQKMRDGKTYQQPFDSSGQEIFENGWKFRFNAASPQTGYLYLLNEGPDGKGGVSYNLLYPMPTNNSGSAQLSSNQQMQTGWYVFDQNQGTERFWVVWSASPVKELDDVKGVVNEMQRGEISDPNQAKAVREFLGKHSSPKPDVARDSAGEKTIVKVGGDVLVSNADLKHR